MSELLKKQKFGVEVEFTGITRTMAAEAVAEILGSHATGPDRTSIIAVSGMDPYVFSMLFAYVCI